MIDLDEERAKFISWYESTRGNAPYLEYNMVAQFMLEAWEARASLADETTLTADLDASLHEPAISVFGYVIPGQCGGGGGPVHAGQTHHGDNGQALSIHEPQHVSGCCVTCGYEMSCTQWAWNKKCPQCGTPRIPD